jgi:hypothetical protein
MSAQLALFPPDLVRAPVDNSRPDVSGMTVPYEWARVADLMRMPSVDFENGFRSLANQDRKRSDPGYDALVDDIARQGMLDPIMLHPPGTRVYVDNSVTYLGNGHHRLLAAYDLGYEWVPVTTNRAYQWRESGISAQSPAASPW